MVLKISKIACGILGVAVILLLVFLNINDFIDTTNRLKDILDYNNLKNWFDVYNESHNAKYQESINKITTTVDGVINSFSSSEIKPIEEILTNLLITLLDFSFNFIIYFCNYGVNIILIAYMILKDTIIGTQEKIRTSKPAQVFIIISKTITKLKTFIIAQIKRLLRFLYTRRRIIAINITIVIIANGLLYNILTEILIFLITYILKTINLESYIVVFSIFKALFTMTYDVLKHTPTVILIPPFTILIFLKAISNANNKLLKNHKEVKHFVSKDLTQTTFINGAPGTGKTLLNVSLSLAAEENYIEELEKNLLDYELKYKYLNFAKVRENPNQYPEHKKYINDYNLLNNRGTFLISNYSIYSPLYNEYSKIFNFDYMRVNKPTEYYPLEEYIVISLSEFDKEYNSHDDKKAVGEDGPATFFSTVSHDLKRHVKVFVDYQLKDQVPLRIRGNAEYYLTVKKRRKCYPLLLGLYYLPIKIINKLIIKLIKKYELKKKYASRKSTRKPKAIYKRNDITLIYAILRNIANKLQTINAFFDQYYYFKLQLHLFQEGDQIKPLKRNININLRDLEFNKQKLYDSTFLSYSYKQKKNQDFKNLDSFTSVTPTVEELSKCNSRFYDKVNN